jgi:hypothetical protein
MRSIIGVKNPQGPADPIIVHPDVRRMLLTQKCIAEGGRALIGYLSQLVDITHVETNTNVKTDADNNLELLTPIAKAFLSELGFECTSHGVQIFGGHGFIKEWGMEQLMRDTKISCLYEGTTGIQALDLLARKILGSRGQILEPFMADVAAFCKDNAETPVMAEYVTTLSSYFEQWQSITRTVGKNAMSNADEIGGASVDYLMFAGYVTLAYFWAKMASVAQSKLQESDNDKAFYQAKIQTATFYFKRILPRAKGHAACIEGGADSIMAIASEDFSF